MEKYHHAMLRNEQVIQQQNANYEKLTEEYQNLQHAVEHKNESDERFKETLNMLEQKESYIEDFKNALMLKEKEIEER